MREHKVMRGCVEERRSADHVSRFPSSQVCYLKKGELQRVGMILPGRGRPPKGAYPAGHTATTTRDCRAPYGVATRWVEIFYLL